MEKTETIKLNKLRDEAYQNAVEHGWHDKDLSDEHFLCMVISELMEAVQANRKGDYAGVGMKELFEEDLATGEDFNGLFESHLKGTVEDELSDVCIRIFDLAGLRSTNFSDMKFSFTHKEEYIQRRKEMTFTEWCYDIIRVICRYNKSKFPIAYLFIGILEEVSCMAQIKGFDLLWHIEQKMKYNRTRPRMHGNKKY